jgi:hypothetical protein
MLFLFSRKHLSLTLIRPKKHLIGSIYSLALEYKTKYESAKVHNKLCENRLYQIFVQTRSKLVDIYNSP